ncbi:MAG: bifunctional glutathionylspermidine amidase/synthase [Pseudomonadales bacterium]|nr:bifunctional glutathionylspermidine amidase/synthase [Pseudomonadales bacterium]
MTHAFSPPARFGTLLGIAPGNVPVYSSDYETADDRELPNRHAYRSYVDGVFMGHKWQCVEFARRWLYLNKGYIFEDVAMAYDIFNLRAVRVIKSNKWLPLHSFRNGAKRHPEPGCLLVWGEGGEFEITGHVAIVSEVLPDRIRFVEQNFHHQVWPQDQAYSREIKASISADGAYWIQCDLGDDVLLGWVIQTDDSSFSEIIEMPDKKLFNLQLREAENRKDPGESWLNIANEDEAIFVKTMGGHKLSTHDEDIYRYFEISETAIKELKRATNELHALFMHATDFVLQNDEWLEKFNLPRALWSRIRQSWDNRKNQMITGRFDFCMTEAGIKVYEYNADSCSCHMECGKVQDKWAEHFEVDAGRSAGDRLHPMLVEAWKASAVQGVLHIMQDQDLEETYHALFMKAALERAGITCKVLKGVSGLHWNQAGKIVDAEGIEVTWVWKTWAWETALDQIRAECEEDEFKLRHYQLDQVKAGTPRLVDVLLRKEVMVYEPLWTLIPSNKAILAVLWMLFPDHPYLLNTQFSLDPSLLSKGYAAKPIAGRCGSNISMVEAGTVIAETSGQFEHHDLIYQALCLLPELQGFSAQVSTFSVAGTYAGSCIRADRNALLTKDSDVLPLRIMPDENML